MTSRFSGDLFSATTGTPPPQPPIVGAGSHLLRRHPDLQIYGPKRSFDDFHQQEANNLRLQQHQYLMRSVKPRTGGYYRFGLPVYNHHQQQQQIPTLSSFNFGISTNGVNGFSTYPNLASGQFGLSGLNQDPNPVRSENNEMLSTLQELEKELLNDDVDENQDDSVITNSEWSDTLNNLIGPGSDSGLGLGSGSGLSSGPDLSPSQGSMSTSGSNNNNNGSMISTSPTSSTSSSSCCSTSASPATSASIKQLITEAAGAISDGKVDPAMELLTRLSQLSNANGSPEQRLGFYMYHALRSRAWPNEYPPRVNELYGNDHRNAIYTLFDISPCFKFSILAANLVMAEAITSSMHENGSTHVIDFNVGHRGQYMHLIRALSERGGARSSNPLKITVVETEVDTGCKELLGAIQDEVLEFAQSVGVSLKFQVVTRAIHELTRESVGCNPSDSIVVNFAYVLGRVPDESVSIENLRDELLRRVKGLRPRAVTLVEQEMNANTAPFMARVGECCAHYGALLEALEAGGAPGRARAEEGLGRKMANAVACEGPDRVERAEVFGKWRARMGMAGFKMEPVGPGVVESVRAKVESGRAGYPGLSVKEESGGVGFGWMGRTLTVASSWR